MRSGYAFSTPTLPVGTYLDTLSGGEPAAVKDLSVGIPLGLLNRHALVAGATGTGKTRSSSWPRGCPPPASRCSWPTSRGT